MRLHLPPRAAAVLAELLTSPREMLSKDHLLECVWDGKPVGDEALMQAISLVRQALGDDARDPRYIETIAGHGYRFIGQVVTDSRELEAGAAAPLSATRETTGDQPPGGPLPAPGRRPGPSRRALLFGLLGIIVILGLSWTTGLPRPPSASSHVTRFTIRPPEGVTLPDPVASSGLAISADGRFIVFVGDGDGRRSIYLRDTDVFEPRLVSVASGSDLRGAGSPFFSPDGAWIGFHQGAGLWKVPRTGGAPTGLRALSHSQGAVWLADDSVIHRWNMRLWRDPGDGGEPTQLGDGNFLWPELLPGGRYLVAIWIGYGTESGEDARIYVVDLVGNEQRELPFRGSAPRWANSGHLLFARHGALYAVPFDPESAEPTGAPVKVLDGLATAEQGVPSYAISDNGTLVYRPADGPPVHRLLRVGPDGDVETILEGDRVYSDVRVSPDGSRLALQSGAAAGNLWLYDLTRASLRRLLPPAFNYSPVWSPDGEAIYHLARNANGSRALRWLDVARPASGRTLLEAPSSFPISPLAGLWSVHPSGSVLLYSPIMRGTTEYDIYALELDGEREPYPLLNSAADEWYAAFSPDGRWLAYVSDESGREEVYLTDYPGLERCLKVSVAGGLVPRWAPDMSALYYEEGSRIMTAPIVFTPDP